MVCAVTHAAIFLCIKYHTSRWKYQILIAHFSGHPGSQEHISLLQGCQCWHLCLVDIVSSIGCDSRRSGNCYRFNKSFAAYKIKLQDPTLSRVKVQITTGGWSQGGFGGERGGLESTDSAGAEHQGEHTPYNFAGDIGGHVAFTWPIVAFTWPISTWPI